MDADKWSWWCFLWTENWHYSLWCSEKKVPMCNHSGIEKIFFFHLHVAGVVTSQRKVEPSSDSAQYSASISVVLFSLFSLAHECHMYWYALGYIIVFQLQLDFQLPIRFNLSFSTEDDAKRERPVIIHRAILGSVERMFAILLEHYAGKWPFWLSPRQVIVCPVSGKFTRYAQEVCPCIAFCTDNWIVHWCILFVQLYSAFESSSREITVKIMWQRWQGSKLWSGISGSWYHSCSWLPLWGRYFGPQVAKEGLFQKSLLLSSLLWLYGLHLSIILSKYSQSSLLAIARLCRFVRRSWHNLTTSW